MSIGERIKEARKKAGLKQSELAEKLGVAVITIGQYERGVRQPRLEQFQRIAAALNVDVNWLMNGYTLEQRDQAMKDYVKRRFAEVTEATEGKIIHQGDRKPTPDCLEQEDLDSTTLKKFLEVMAKLSQKDWEILNAMIKQAMEEDLPSMKPVTPPKAPSFKSKATASPTDAYIGSKDTTPTETPPQRPQEDEE